MKNDTNTMSRLRGKTVAVFTRHRPATLPVLLEGCMLEDRGGRLFLVGTGLPAERSATDWTDGVRRAIAWDAIEEYLVFDTADDYYARSHTAAQSASAGPEIEMPQSDEGNPVEPSGIRVENDTPLYVGSTVLSYVQGRWWRAEVIALEADDQVTIHYPGWDSKWDATVPKTELQVDLQSSLEVD